MNYYNVYYVKIDSNFHCFKLFREFYMFKNKKQHFGKFKLKVIQLIVQIGKSFLEEVTLSLFN